MPWKNLELSRVFDLVKWINELRRFFFFSLSISVKWALRHNIHSFNHIRRPLLILIFGQSLLYTEQSLVERDVILWKLRFQIDHGGERIQLVHLRSFRENIALTIFLEWRFWHHLVLRWVPVVVRAGEDRLTRLVNECLLRTNKVGSLRNLFSFIVPRNITWKAWVLLKRLIITLVFVEKFTGVWLVVWSNVELRWVFLGVVFRSTTFELLWDVVGWQPYIFRHRWLWESYRIVGVPSTVSDLILFANKIVWVYRASSLDRALRA